MVAFVAKWFDQSLDKLFERGRVEGFEQATGRVGLILLAAFVVLALSMLVWWEGRKIEQPAYFLVRANQEPARLPVLNSPSLSAAKISSWSSRALRDIFRFGFRDVEERLEQSSVYFTTEAYSDFLAALEKSELLTRVREDRLIISLTPLEEPVLVSTVVVNGKRVIRVETVVAITYVGGEEPVVQYRLMEMLVSPVETTEDPEGLAIVRLRPYPYDPFVIK